MSLVEACEVQRWRSLPPPSLQTLHEREAQIIAVQQAALDTARLDREAAINDAKACAQRLELLSAERAALSTALEDARAALKREAAERAHEQSQLRDALRQRDAYQEQLLRVHAEARSSGDDRILSEVSRLREGSARDLDELRRTAREAYDREVAGLKDSRAAAVAEAQRTQERLDALQVRSHGERIQPAFTRNTRAFPLQRRFDEGALAQQVSSAESERTAAELRGLLKLKSLECERAAMVAAEHAASASRLTAECTGLREKISVLQVRRPRVMATYSWAVDAAHVLRCTLFEAIQCTRVPCNAD